MDKSDFVIRQLGYPELELAIDWAARESWNPGLNDGTCFFSADAEGFLGGFLGERAIATISAVRYGKEFGFIGFFIVEPGFRGQGYGSLLWKEALNRLEGRAIGLDGVISQQDYYRRSGFILAHRNIRYQGYSTSFPDLGERHKPASQMALERLAEYDKSVFGFERRVFLRTWLEQEHSFAMVSVEADWITGYGAVRPCREGFKIGPLFAAEPRIAEMLFEALNSSLPEGSKVFLDIPEPNREALALVKRHSMTPVFETARMYKGKIPDLPLEQIFGITSFELG